MFKKIILLSFIAGTWMNAQQNFANTSANEFAIRSGVNVSHWLSQNDARGEERTKEISKSDFEHIATMGFDHVRIPIDEVQFWDERGNKHTDAFQLLHQGIAWAFASNLRVIVDLHIIRSHYFGAESNKLWTDSVEQQKLINFWLQLSEELRKYPVSKLAYEIMNEAVAVNPNDWNKVFNKAIAALRTQEPKRKIVIGSNMWQIPSTFPDLKLPENDKNIILSFHFYVPIALTHHTASWAATSEYKGPVNYPGWIVDTAEYKNLSEKTVNAMRTMANGCFTKEVLKKEMQPAIDFAQKHNLPLYCGEFGVYPAIPEEIMLRWYKDVCENFRENNIAYCHWCYKGDFPVVEKNGAPKQKLVSILTAK
ncbi:MAG TPA: cellulase family glycosylhydrolase [Bacteroidota bacterium]|nr:cellulase family glycosylhydrolase [Bacteroidota bacterium]